MDTEQYAYIFGCFLTMLFTVIGIDMLQGKLKTGWIWLTISACTLPFVWFTSWLR